MSVPRNLSDRRDQRGWLLAIPLLAVLVSFLYFGDPFKLRAPPAAEVANATPTQLVMTMVVLQPAPTQPTPIASSTPVPTPANTVTPPPTASVTSTTAESTSIATVAVATSTVTPTPTDRVVTATPRPPTATLKVTATVVTATPRPLTATPTVPTITPRPPSVTPTASLVPGPGPNGTWVVARGDSCARIASQAGVSVEALVRANALQNNCFLRAGQVLIIPTPGAVAATVSATPTARPTSTATPTPLRATVTPPPTLGPPVTRTATPLPTIGPPATPTAAATTAAINGNRSYTVKAGDTCFRISRAESVAVEDLIRVNNLDARCFLSVGQTLVLP
jgi:LysM repeat protein